MLINPSEPGLKLPVSLLVHTGPAQGLLLMTEVMTKLRSGKFSL